MKALILIDNQSGFACDGCVFENEGCPNNDIISEQIGDCAPNGIYQIVEVEVIK